MAVKILNGHEKLNPKLLIGFQFNEGRHHKKLTGSELDDFAWLVWQSRGEVHLTVRFKLLDMFICFSTRNCYFILFTCMWHCVVLWHIQVSGSIFNQVSQSPCAHARLCSVPVFYCSIQVSLCIASLLRIRRIFEGFGGKRALGFLLKIELCRKCSKLRMQFCLGALNNALYVFLLKFSSFTRYYACKKACICGLISTWLERR